MMSPISSTNWVCSTQQLEELAAREQEILIEPMASGLEAEVMKLQLDQKAYVYKVWNRDSKPDVNRQFLLLQALINSGVQVSVPYGSGVDPDGNAALLMSHDGMPPEKVNKQMLTELAGRLVELHQMTLDGISPELLPTNDFIEYFFPNIEAHSDLHDRLLQLINRVGYRHERIIHGDYNLGNVVFNNNGTCTIIDWTNGQLGDSRYDYAWSAALMRIFVGDRYKTVFRNAYLASFPMEPQEEQTFEAMSMIRYLLLNRQVGLIRQSTTKSKVKRILAGNPDLAGLYL
ncbi:aminoglycoside phosphotransferase (APT) family kinase protein [Paenibacillus cellulosilyticus]|uniref:Aminoglycoside phosphotransferase (APT) family kinase protein n=1 Tax=Paenibacillus cellulosilyticus TaxID=375489 RepID=A0A2V2YPT4_9BACL|nr:aminoglycoside phosphotransferase family protein [Paenibacillus cellulosilyticus]PWV98436.1 aminoglycoside phosphotransferase (APT) family kinase protein [Paenibacillus cellulosilyticus]QKS43283.1 aminoglycoside phosphotransferase family protein [Paenibacillus cellulosilyticus]